MARGHRRDHGPMVSWDTVGALAGVLSSLVWSTSLCGPNVASGSQQNTWALRVHCIHCLGLLLITSNLNNHSSGGFFFLFHTSKQGRLHYYLMICNPERKLVICLSSAHPNNVTAGGEETIEPSLIMHTGLVAAFMLGNHIL